VGQSIIEAAGRGSISGAVTSRTIIVCDVVEELLQASVAIHVRVILYDPAQEPGVVTSVKVKINELPHSSVALAWANNGVAGQSIVVMPGSGSNNGAVISCTLMVCEAVEELPQASVAVHVRVTLYDPAQAPGVVTSFEVNVNALPQASTAVATANTGRSGQFMVVGEGSAEITGSVISCTLMV
jgi:hypothetical protein